MDDGYNPANTQQVVRQLVLQDKVFAILNGLGTPTHTGVLDFLKSNRVPDLFVASGSRSWNQPDKYPGTFGFNPDYTVEGKILGQLRRRRTWPARRSASSARTTTSAGTAWPASRRSSAPGRGGQADVRHQQHQRGAADRRAQGGRLPGRRARHRARLHRARRRHGGPAGLQAAVAWSPTSAPTTRPWPSSSAPPRRCWRAWSAPTTCRCRTTTANPWIQLFTKVNKEYNGDAPFDGNTVYGMSVGYLFVQALLAAGKDLTREGDRGRRRRAASRAPGWRRCASPPRTTPGTAASG